ncbi:hypothetical protein F5Y06DRAFT_229520 [Hypoxylon sp. FL0890]|nr:hypothetical protein F5Y06DRAFT_229520 [Hypoxylon sp. FL0890]
MEPKKSFATTESASDDDATLFDLDPPVGRRVRVHQASPIHPERRSQSSIRSESNPPAFSPCATRESPEENCALQRFIVWTAVKRNKSVRMVPDDRLKCPLILCGERFDDHETMLRHLTKCRHLETGEYLCYDCMKVEKFNDGKCRCCVGHRTKRRRIINLAKNFFSNIGHRSRRGIPESNFQDDFASSPPSYDSVVIDLDEQSQQRQRQQQEHEQSQEQRQQSQPRPQLELNGREIHELDSTQTLPTAELDSVNYDRQPVGISAALNRHNATPDVLACTQMNMSSWQEGPPTRQLDDDHSMPPPKLAPSSTHGTRPSLALDTHMDRYRSVPRTKHLSPSSSLRSTRSSQNVSPVTPWSANSGTSGTWTMVSTVDTAMTSPITPVSPNDLPPASQLENILSAAKPTTACPDDGCNYLVDNIPELPGDDLLSIPRGLSDPLFFSFDPKDNYSWMQSVDTELSLATSVNMMFTDHSSKPASMPSGFLEPSDRGPETKTLVESAWDALQEHVSSSLLKLSHVEGNALVQRLRAQSTKAVALTGLSSLRNILQGNDLTDPHDYICFVHLIYAFSLTIHENELATRSNLLYQQALAYQRLLGAAHVEDYTQIVATIWQPTSDVQSRTRRGISAGEPSNPKGKEPDYGRDSRINAETDPLVAVGQNFLDDLENSVIASGSQKPTEVHTSELWSTHLIDFQPETVHDSPFTITVDYIIQVLSSKYHESQMLLSKLREIGQGVHVGYITTVRKFELAILQAGKNSLDSSDLFDEFIPQVRRLCDPIYLEQGFASRTRYQILGVSLVETLVETIAADSQHTQEPGNFIYGEFLEHLHETFVDPDDFLANLGTSAPQQNQTELAIASSFNSPIGAMALRDINPSAQQPPTAPKSFTTTSSNTGTPSEPFIGSPLPSRPTLVPSPPKPQTPGGSGASPQPASSTSQKVEANDACEICGYRPKGDPQWFKGSMAKHKKMQHSAGPPIIYKCPYPGCNSQYKNRQDNLRQHQIEKNHFVGDEANRRPSKRKKTSPSA